MLACIELKKIQAVLSDVSKWLQILTIQFQLTQ